MENKDEIEKAFDNLEIGGYCTKFNPISIIEKGFAILNIKEGLPALSVTNEDPCFIEKSLNTAGLVKKKVQIHAANGKMYEGYRWVHTGVDLPNIKQQKQEVNTTEKNPIKDYLKENGHKNIDRVHKEIKEKFKLSDEEAKSHIDKHVNDNLKKHGFLSDKGEIQLKKENSSTKEKNSPITEENVSKPEKIKSLVDKGVHDPSIMLQMHPELTTNDLNHYVNSSEADKKKVQETLENNINVSLGNIPEKKDTPVYKLQEEMKSKDLSKMLRAKKEERAKKEGITYKDKFESYKFKLDQLIKDKMTRSLIVYGTGGVGKSYNLEQKLIENGKVGWDPELDLNPDEYDYVKITGNTSPTDMYNILYKNKDKLVIFDDADSMWDNDEMANMLKGALDTTGDRAIHYGNPKADQSGKKAPTDFKFDGQMIFISNLPREKFYQPLIDSRSNALNLSMDMDQTLEMMDSIKDKFKYRDANDKEIDISKEDRNDILKVLHDLKDDLRVEQVNGRTMGNLAALKVGLTKKGEKDYNTFKKNAMISLDLV